MTWDPLQIAWLAGLYEGEGSVQVVHRGPRVQVHVKIISTDEDVIARALTITGVGRLYGPYVQTGSLGLKPRYCWIVCRRADSLRVLTAFLPYLGTRRRVDAEQAVITLNGYEPRCWSRQHVRADVEALTDYRGNYRCGPCYHAAQERKLERQRERRRREKDDMAVL